MSDVLLDEQADAIDNVLNQYNIIGYSRYSNGYTLLRLMKRCALEKICVYLVGEKLRVCLI